MRKSNKKEEKLEQELRDKALMKFFFDLLWSELPKDKFCFSCGKKIWGENKPLYWDHLLEKQKYPEYKYEKENMYFCCGDCHESKSSGYPTEKHKAAIEAAKQKFLKNE